MFSIFTYIMSRVTHSEPGLPMLISLTNVRRLCVKLWVNFGHFEKEIFLLKDMLN